MNNENQLQEQEIQELKERLLEKERRLDGEIREIKELLAPLLETYQTSIKLGKWIMGILVLISILIGIILGLKSLIK